MVATNKELATFGSIPGLAVSAGLIAGTNALLKVGYSDTIGTSEVTVWPLQSRYPFPTSAEQVTVSSTSPSDTAGGTGVQSVFVSGVDANYRRISETIATSGQSGALSVNSYLRVNAMIALTVGSAGHNVGTLYTGTGTVSGGGVPAVVLAVATPTDGRSLQAVWTAPDKERGFIVAFSASSFGNQNNFATVRIKIRDEGKAWTTRAKFTVSRGSVPSPAIVPILVTPRSDLEVTALSDGGTIDLTAALSMVRRQAGR